MSACFPRCSLRIDVVLRLSQWECNHAADALHPALSRLVCILVGCSGKLAFLAVLLLRHCAVNVSSRKFFYKSLTYFQQMLVYIGWLPGTVLNMFLLKGISLPLKMHLITIKLQSQFLPS